MPVLIAILGALAAAFWWYRLKMANDMAQDIFGAANDARRQRTQLRSKPP